MLHLRGTILSVAQVIFSLESVAERSVECVEFCGWQGMMRRNSLAIATIRNAARRKRQRAIQIVAAPPEGELSIPIKCYAYQHINTLFRRSTTEPRLSARYR